MDSLVFGSDSKLISMMNLNESSTNITHVPTVNVAVQVGPGDAVWILTSAFIIFTMISGFGLVESGQYHI